MNQYNFFIVFMGLLWCNNLTQAMGRPVDFNFNYKPQQFVARDAMPKEVMTPALAESIVKAQNSSYRGVATGAIVNEALASHQAASSMPAGQSVNASRNTGPIINQFVDFTSAAVQAVPQKATIPSGVTMESAPAFNPNLLNFPRYTTSGSLGGSLGRLQILQKPTQQKTTAVEAKNVQMQEPVTMQAQAPMPLLLTYNSNFKNVEPAQVVQAPSMVTPVPSAYYPMFKNPEFIEPQKTTQSSAPLLLRYDPNFNNEQVGANLGQPKVTSEQIQVSSQDLYTNLFAEPFSNSVSEQSLAQNQSLSNYYTKSKQFNGSANQQRFNYIQPEASTEIWQGQGHPERKTVSLPVHVIDIQMQSAGDVGPNEAKLETQNLVDPTSLETFTTSLVPLLDEQLKSKQYATSSSSSFSIILDLLTKVKDMILELLGYKPSPVQGQAINDKINQRAENFVGTLPANGTIDTVALAQQGGLLMQDILSSRQQDVATLQASLQNGAAQARAENVS